MEGLAKGLRKRQTAGMLTQDRTPLYEFAKTVGLTPAELIESMVIKYFSKRFDKAGAKVLPSTPGFHREIWTACGSEHPQVARVAPRGHAKSTAGTHCYGLTESLFRACDNIVIVSNTEDQASLFLKGMAAECSDNTELRTDFEIVEFEKDNDTELIVVFSDGYKFRVTAYGSEQQLRGTIWNGKRPNLILLDDFENPEQMQEEKRRNKIKDVLLNDIIPAGSDDCRFRAFGTILHDASALNGLTKDNTWDSKIYRAHAGFDDFSNPLWPEKWPVLKLYQRRQTYINQGKPEGYSQEYLNDPTPPEIAYFHPDWYQKMGPEKVEYHQKRLLRYYAAMDLAVSTKNTADYSVIVVVGVDDLGYLYVVDVRRGRWDSLGIINEIFDVHDTYNPELFGMEKGVIEKSILPFLNQQQLERAQKGKSYVNIHPMPAEGDKPKRARSIQGKMKARHVYFDMEAAWWAPFAEELRRFPRGTHDDQVDALAYIGLMLAEQIPANTEGEREEEEYEIEFGDDMRLEGANPITGY